MTKGLFYSQIEEINKILSKYGLLKNYIKRSEFSNYSRSILRTVDHKELYLGVLNNDDYTFQLFDNSLIQLAYQKSNGNLVLGYYYIPFPLQAISYEDYLLSAGFNYEETGDVLIEEYEQHLTECPPRKNIQTIRYDYSTKEYFEKIHPVSHIHIGFSEIKISSKKIITPITFLLFLLKQIYYNEWKSIINDRYFNQCFNASKSKCKDVPKNFFSNNDEKELYLI